MKLLLLVLAFLIPMGLSAGPHEMDILPSWTLASDSDPSIRWNRCSTCHTGEAMIDKPVPDNHPTDRTAEMWDEIERLIDNPLEDRVVANDNLYEPREVRLGLSP